MGVGEDRTQVGDGAADVVHGLRPNEKIRLAVTVQVQVADHGLAELRIPELVDLPDQVVVLAAANLYHVVGVRPRLIEDHGRVVGDAVTIHVASRGDAPEGEPERHLLAHAQRVPVPAGQEP